MIYQVQDISIKDKRVLIRTDLNLEQMSQEEILQDDRFLELIKSTQSLKQACKQVIILSHLGRPKGEFVASLSLQKFVPALEAKLKLKIDFFDFKSISERKKLVSNAKIVLLENLRFFIQEDTNEAEFAKYLASMGDVYVNDAFAVAHRICASNILIPNYLPSVLGENFAKEKFHVDRLFANNSKNILVILGGAKFIDKIDLLISFVGRAKNIYLAGQNAKIYLRYLGYPTYECETKEWESLKELCQKLQKTFQNSNTKLILPIDFVGQNGNIELKNVVNDSLFDLGEQSSRLLSTLVHDADVIFWNGPLGKIEDKQYQKASKLLLKDLLNQKNSIRLLGGGDTGKIIPHNFVSDEKMYISTAGGALLSYLTHNSLPSLLALESSAKKFANNFK